MSATRETAAPRFVPMTEHELQQVLDIENANYEFPWSRNIFLDCIKVGYRCVALQLDGVVAAYAVMSVAANEAHLLNLCVAPEYQGRGYGRVMLEHMLDAARRLHAGTCFLEVRRSNRKAIRLYHAAGFNQIGIRKDYYPAVQGREDAVTYAIELRA